jgi:hypothetical protein
MPRVILVIAAAPLFGAGSASASARKPGWHYHDDGVVDPDTGPVNQFGGRLVYHTASNIACTTHYHATRAALRSTGLGLWQPLRS